MVPGTRQPCRGDGKFAFGGQCVPQRPGGVRQRTCRTEAAKPIGRSSGPIYRRKHFAEYWWFGSGHWYEKPLGERAVQRACQYPHGPFHRNCVPMLRPCDIEAEPHASKYRLTSASGVAGAGSTRCARRAPQIPQAGCRVSAFGNDPSRKSCGTPRRGHSVPRAAAAS